MPPGHPVVVTIPFSCCNQTTGCCGQGNQVISMKQLGDLFSIHLDDNAITSEFTPSVNLFKHQHFAPH